MPRTTRLRRTTAVALAATVVGGLGAGCSMFQQAPAPEDTARALAAGLAKADVTGVALKGSTTQKVNAFLATAFKGMDGTRPTVSLQKMSHADGSEKATATLATTWNVSPASASPPTASSTSSPATSSPAPSDSASPATTPTTWSYTTQVPLTLVDDTWQVSWSPGIVAPDLRSDESLTLARTWPRRADILDRNGAKLMTEREVAVVGIDKTKVSGSAAAASARTLAALVGVDPGRYATKVSQAGAKAFVEAITFRADDPQLTKNGAAIDKVTGAVTVPALTVLGPSRTFAAPILGTVGEVSAEDVKASKGALEAGDVIGKNGLEYRYDARLRGAPGLSVQAVRRGADGSVIDKREVYAQQSKDGTPLTLTIDQKLQSAAEAALAGQTQRPTALVAVRISTGEVLAAAVGPGANGAPLALAGKNPPGSTFKIVSSLALVRKGDTADTKLPCTDSLTVDGRQFGNYTTYPKNHLGDIPMQTALAFSCNTAFISQHDKVSQDDLISAAQSLGMGEKLDLPFTGFLGSVPGTENTVEHAASFIGQGRVEASPLTMALVVASVVKGQTVRPVLVKDAPALPAPATPLKPEEAQVLRQEMHAVVQEGSGTVLKPLGVEYAKTGTAEFGTKNPPDTHTWMVAGRGDIAIAAYNELGDNGVTGSAPFIVDFLKKTNLR